jgi:signal transduction histidine kinase
VLAEEKEQALAFQARSEAVIEGDPQTLQQALFNLVENGIKYAPREGTITVSAGRDPDGTVRMEVEDDGPGIPPGEREKIFERFYRTEKARDADRKGFGLGLAITALAIQANGGTLQAGERPGGGAIFTLRFPPPKPHKPSAL